MAKKEEIVYKTQAEENRDRLARQRENKEKVRRLMEKINGLMSEAEEEVKGDKKG